MLSAIWIISLRFQFSKNISLDHSMFPSHPRKNVSKRKELQERKGLYGEKVYLFFLLFKQQQQQLVPNLLQKLNQLKNQKKESKNKLKKKVARRNKRRNNSKAKKNNNHRRKRRKLLRKQPRSQSRKQKHPRLEFSIFECRHWIQMILESLDVFLSDK